MSSFIFVREMERESNRARGRRAAGSTASAPDACTAIGSVRSVGVNTAVII